MADDERLLDELGRKPLDYSRRRFLGTWLALGTLAILTGVALTLAIRNADTNLEQTDDIARVAQSTADGAQESTDDVVRFLRGEQGIPGVPGANGEDGTPGQPGASAQPGDRGRRARRVPRASRGHPVQRPERTARDDGGTRQHRPDRHRGSAGTEGPAGRGRHRRPARRTRLNGKEGAAGPAGPQGAQGPPGSPGPPGGAPNTSIAVGSSANDTTTSKSVQVTCPAGRASGGGYAVVPSDPGLIVTASSPGREHGLERDRRAAQPAAGNRVAGTRLRRLRDVTR